MNILIDVVFSQSLPIFEVGFDIILQLIRTKTVIKGTFKYLSYSLY